MEIEPVVSQDDLGIFEVEERTSSADELQKFCDSNDKLAGGTSAEVLAWWKINSRKYPNLSKMAKDFLAIPATSASSERLFSSGKHLISDTRCSLGPTTIEACQTLKSWI